MKVFCLFFLSHFLFSSSLYSKKWNTQLVDEILAENVKESRVKMEDFLAALHDQHDGTESNSLDGRGHPFYQYFMIYHSRSNQFASREYPRVILPMRYGSLIFAFNAGVEGPGKDNLEIIEWIEHDKRFEFSVIDFSKPELKREFPKTCNACHGEDPRPNWDSYPNWPGLVGSDDHYVADTGENRGIEYDILRDFVAHQSRNPRFRHLKTPYSGIPYLREGDKFPPEIEKKISYRENLVGFFNIAVHTLNEHRLCRLIVQALEQNIKNPTKQIAIKQIKKIYSEIPIKDPIVLASLYKEAPPEYKEYANQWYRNNLFYIFARYKLILKLSERKWDYKSFSGRKAQEVKDAYEKPSEGKLDFNPSINYLLMFYLDQGLGVNLKNWSPAYVGPNAFLPEDMEEFSKNDKIVSMDVAGSGPKLIFDDLHKVGCSAILGVK